MPITILEKIRGVLSGIKLSHTTLPTEFVSSGFVGPTYRQDGAAGYVDDRVRNRAGYVDYAPRKIIPDLVGGGTAVSESYPQSAAHAKYTEDFEANVPRQARGHKLDTLTEVHDNRTEFDTASGSMKKQPVNPFGAKYPYNHDRETESGHLFEADDTPDAERIKESHRTGTYYEIFPDGSRVVKVVKDDFVVIVGDSGVNVQGVACVTVEGDCELLVVGDLTHTVEGDYDLRVGGNLIADVGGTITLDALATSITGALDVAAVTTLQAVTSIGVPIGSTHKHTAGGYLGDADATVASPVTGTSGPPVE